MKPAYVVWSKTQDKPRVTFAYRHFDCKQTEPLKLRLRSLVSFAQFEGAAHWQLRSSWQKEPEGRRGMQPLPSSGQKKPRSQRGGSSSIGWKPYWNSSLRQSLFMHVPSTGVVKFPSLLNKLGEEEFDEEGAQNVRSSQSERNLWVVASILLFETVQFPPSATDPQRPYAILKENSSSSRARMCRIEVQRLLVERHAIRSVVSAHRRGGDQDQADLQTGIQKAYGSTSATRGVSTKRGSTWWSARNLCRVRRADSRVPQRCAQPSMSKPSSESMLYRARCITVRRTNRNTSVSS